MPLEDIIMEEIYATENKNLTNTDQMKIKFLLKTDNPMQLLDRYKKLLLSYKPLDYEEDYTETKNKIARISFFIKENYPLDLLDYIKDGIPGSLRIQTYTLLLDVKNSPRLKETDNSSKSLYFIYNFERNYEKEFQLLCDDTRYFLFYDLVKKLFQMLIADTKLVTDTQADKPLILLLDGPNGECQPFPPSGNIFYKGIPYLLAPFCFLSRNPDEIYSVFRELYGKYLCYLQSFSSNPLSLLCSYLKQLLFTVSILLLLLVIPI